MKKFLIILAVAALAALTTSPTVAADAKPAADAKATAAARALPFNGKIAAVDKQAKTVKVGERVFQVTSTTRLTKDNKTTTLDDAKVGEEVGGSYREGDDKKLNLVSLRIGPKPDAPAKKDAAPKKDAPAK